jgi:hypothetical protein
VLGATWQEAEDYLLTDQNRRLAEMLDESIRAIGEQAATKFDKQNLYDQLMAYLSHQEQTIPGGRDNPDYQRIHEAVSDFVKSHRLFIASEAPPVVATVAPPLDSNLGGGEFCVTSAPAVRKSTAPGTSGAGTSACRPGEIHQAGGNLLPAGHALGYGTAAAGKIPPEVRHFSRTVAQAIAAQFAPQDTIEQAAAEFGLMFRAFLDNDGEIDLEEQAQLLELQEELGLTNEQVETIETNIREELGRV